MAVEHRTRRGVKIVADRWLTNGTDLVKVIRVREEEVLVEDASTGSVVSLEPRYLESWVTPKQWGARGA